MDAMQFWRSVGTARARAVVEAAGTKWSYFKHLANRRKRASVDLARALVRESAAREPAHAMDLDSLLPPKTGLRT